MVDPKGSDFSLYKGATIITPNYSEFSLAVGDISDERDFNHRWNRTLLNLLNKPSKNKTMINLGVYKPKDQSGLYNIKNTAELLRGKVAVFT